jgi:hypothetical protein
MPKYSINKKSNYSQQIKQAIHLETNINVYLRKMEMIVGMFQKI